MKKNAVIATGIIIIVSSILIVLTCVPIITRIQRTESDRTDILLHNGFMPDYAVYLATITMGQHGMPYFRNYFSSSETQPLPIHGWYIVTGLLSAPFSLWPPYAYHIARSITVILFALTILWFTSVYFKNSKQGLVATLVILLIPIAPLSMYSQEIAATFMPWWLGTLETIERIDPPPHHLLAQMFLLLSLGCFFQWRRHALQYKYAFLSSICAVLCAATVPHTMLVWIAVVGTYTICSLLQDLTKKHQPSTIVKEIIILALYTLPVMATLAALSYLFAPTLWQKSRTWEINFWNRDSLFFYHYYVSFLFLIPFAIPAALKGIKTYDKERISLIVWALLPLLLLPFLETLGMGKSRLLQTIIHIPLTLLAVSTLSDIIFHKRIRMLITISLLALMMVYSGTRIYISLQQSRNYILNEPYDWRYYIPTTYYEATQWIKENIPQNSYMMAREDIANWIVSFAPVIVYAGDQTHGYNWDRDLTRINTVYAQNISHEDAKAFFTSQHISYVVDEQYQGQFSLDSYPFLTPLWKNADIKIYKVSQ